jgi:hypothetical protein
MAEDGSWPGIRDNGLLSTSALLDLYGYRGDARREIESEYRCRKHTLQREGLPPAVVRDQLPMPPGALRPCLDDNMTPEEWYELVNGRIFFWPTLDDLRVLLAAKEYKNCPHVVISISTAQLLSRHADDISLSPINSGSTYYNSQRAAGPARRGRTTFQSIERFTGSRVKEVVVQHGVPDIKSLNTTVERWIAHRKNYEPASYECLGRVWPS